MKQLKSSSALFLAAVVWGFAFVAQSEGMRYVGGFTFNCVRSLIGGLVLIPCIFLMRGLQDRGQDGRQDENQNDGGAGGRAFTFMGIDRTVLRGGICCGIFLCIASNLQQHGIKYTTVGKAGFITALYIVLVPIFGLFLHKRVGKTVWIGLALAVAGLYFLCIDGQFTVEIGDLLVFLCAIFFALQILAVDHFAPRVDCVVLSCIEFFTSGILSAVPMFMCETVSWEGLVDAAAPILYAGVMSCGVAYTLQIVGQKNMNPTVASMIMSLESVISVLAGFLLLHQRLSARELVGCVLMFAAVLLSQLPEKKSTVREKERRKT
ncbi:MAG: DMT family transporter [Acetatifactor sp.]|nr:DMT family transporter [Acetatifactor sp.]